MDQSVKPRVSIVYDSGLVMEDKGALVSKIEMFEVVMFHRMNVEPQGALKPEGRSKP